MADSGARRQPLTVTVRLEGEPTDQQFWAAEFARLAESKGNHIQRVIGGEHTVFTIIPRSIEA